MPKEQHVNLRPEKHLMIVFLQASDGVLLVRQSSRIEFRFDPKVTQGSENQ
jgi:hypothetical protein